MKKLTILIAAICLCMSLSAAVTATLTLRLTIPPAPASFRVTENSWYASGDGIASVSLICGDRVITGSSGSLEGLSGNVHVIFTAI